MSHVASYATYDEVSTKIVVTTTKIVRYEYVTCAIYTN